MNKEWRLTSFGALHYAQWNDSDEVVLYYTGSGDTYLISQLGYIILNMLQDSAKTREALLDALAASDGPFQGLSSIPEEMVDSHLFHFEKLGLVVS